MRLHARRIGSRCAEEPHRLSIHIQPRLASNAIAVFLGDPDALTRPARRRRALDLLGEEERARIARFRFACDRDVALASRALQRRALSACAPVPPSHWRFLGRGRPRIAYPTIKPALEWNVANTRGLVACAVTVDRALGIDVERVPREAVRSLVETHLAASERAQLEALPASERPRRFVELWTLKEAYLKARGLGLSIGLDLIACDPTRSPPELALDPEVADDASNWQLVQWWPTSAHCIAICVASGPRLAIEIHGEPA
jgi:4'-phosphopantetheinyl transferase